MYISIKQSSCLEGKVTPPSSKSQTIRAILLSLLAKGESTFFNPLDSEDTEDAIKVALQLGAKIRFGQNQWLISSPGLPLQAEVNTGGLAHNTGSGRKSSIYTGNSGITTRFLLPLLGFRHSEAEPLILSCGEQMQARPIHPLVQALRELGLSIHYLEKEGCLPLSITGQLQGGMTTVDGITSQYLSALLLALPCAPQDSTLVVKDLNERPYMEMTLEWLREQGIHYKHHQEKNKDIYYIQGRQRYSAFRKEIAGDFSSASYLIAAGALFQGMVELNGLDMADPQGDKRLVDILLAMGAKIEIEPQRLLIHGGYPLQGITIDANDIPDLLPTLAVIGSQAQGQTHILNVPQARIKETDRIHSMTEGLRCLGAKVEEYSGGMTVHQSTLQGGRVKGYGDHRTVMALTLAGMLAEGNTWVEDSAAINKTFPNFITLMKSLGATLEVCHDILI